MSRRHDWKGVLLKPRPKSALNKERRWLMAPHCITTASVLKLRRGHELHQPGVGPRPRPRRLRERLKMAAALINDSDIWRLEYFGEPAALSAGTYAAKVKHPISRNCLRHQREVVIFFVLCSVWVQPPRPLQLGQLAHAAAGDSDAMLGFENKPKQV